MELTPRTIDEPARSSSRKRRAPVTVALLAVVVVALGFVVWQGLSNATLYFYNADIAVAKRDSLGDRRFRLQGTVEEGSIAHDGEQVSFVVVFDKVAVPVRHVGDPPELFRPGIPVVLEGHWDGTTFASDRILVKHSEQYQSEDEYQDRLKDAEQGGDGGAAP